jgi:hypothetical protein
MVDTDRDQGPLILSDKATNGRNVSYMAHDSVFGDTLSD